MNWQEVSELEPIWLNLGGGEDKTGKEGFEGYVAVDMTAQGEWSVGHDLTTPIPLGNGSVERFLSEHFFEHIPMESGQWLLQEIHRLLKPGGIARIAVPDYDHPGNRQHRKRGSDPNHTDHVWFPVYRDLLSLVEASPFQDFEFRSFWDGNRYVEQEVDYSLGLVKRTPDNDRRNRCKSFSHGLVRLVHDLGVPFKFGPFAPKSVYLAQRYHRLRMTSIVVDLRK